MSGGFILEQCLSRFIQDHVAIVKAIYREVMGEVSAWPIEEEARAYDIGKWLGAPRADAFQEDNDCNEDGEYEEEGWEWGPLFGFSSEGPATLANGDRQADEGVAALEDAAPDTYSPGFAAESPPESVSLGSCDTEEGSSYGIEAAKFNDIEEANS